MFWQRLSIFGGEQILVVQFFEIVEVMASEAAGRGVGIEKVALGIDDPDGITRFVQHKTQIGIGSAALGDIVSDAEQANGLAFTVF